MLVYAGLFSGMKKDKIKALSNSLSIYISGTEVSVFSTSVMENLNSNEIKSFARHDAKLIQ